MTKKNSISIKIVNVFVFILILASCTSKLDKSANKYCDCLKENQDLSVVEKVMVCDTLLGNVYSWNDDVPAMQQKNKEIDAILMKDCPDYAGLKNFIVGNLGDWTNLDTVQKSVLLDTDCDEFKNHINFYYLGQGGDTIRLKIKDGIWMDSFSKGKYYSYLKMVWVSSCKFKIEMIETTEPNRKSIFIKGDIFEYDILDKKDNYYELMVSFNNSIQKFKLYIID